MGDETDGDIDESPRDEAVALLIIKPNGFSESPLVFPIEEEWAVGGATENGAEANEKDILVGERNQGSDDNDDFGSVPSLLNDTALARR